MQWYQGFGLLTVMGTLLKNYLAVHCVAIAVSQIL